VSEHAGTEAALWREVGELREENNRLHDVLATAKEEVLFWYGRRAGCGVPECGVTKAFGVFG